MALQVAPGVNVTSATYAIQGPNGFSTTGTVAVGTTANITFNVMGLPTGMGFMVSVAAVASDGMTTCTGSQTFNVNSLPMTTPVVVHLTCGPGGTAGVTESTDVCPIVDGIDASPAAAESIAPPSSTRIGTLPISRPVTRAAPKEARESGRNRSPAWTGE